MISQPSSKLNVSRETQEKLLVFAQLVKKWTKSINLIAPKSVDDLWNRHIADSAQVYSSAPAHWSSWADLGSGGGFPGVVVAIMDAEARPVTLVESDSRKSMFLKAAKRELSLNLTVVNERIEQANLPHFDVVSARAFASLPKLLNYTQRLLRPEGVALFLKGRNYQLELEDALKTWHFHSESIVSKTEPDARLLKISRISLREH